jgi:hypothetical protein
MRNTRLAAIVLAVIGLAAAYATLRSFDVLAARGLAEVKAVASGDQEIAWIAAATSSDTWERLVAALRNLEETWPKIHPSRRALRVDFSRAFLDLTVETPEIGLSIAGNDATHLWLRWYKVSSEAHARAWVEKLTRRTPPPLAVIGGDTSDRALSLARTLRKFRDRWSGRPPLLLLTTATADRYDPDGHPDPVLTRTDWPKLMDVYKDRSFRFAFTNTRMAEAVVDFAHAHGELWTDTIPQAVTALVPGPGPWPSIVALAADVHFQAYSLYTLAWNDDRYSLDLSDRFVKVFTDTFGPEAGGGWRGRIVSDNVDYSVGDYYQPNPSEAYAVNRFLLEPAQGPYRRQLLVLPTGAQPARRFLRTLVRRAPLEARKLVVLTGDSLTFNTIYRDRETAWNVLEMPVPLVLFSHRNPIDETAGFQPQADAEHPAATTGTQDLLLHRDLMEALTTAAFREGELLADADELNRRLRESRWIKGRIFVNDGQDRPEGGGVPLFDADGDRHNRTGEHIVWLRPLVEEDRTLPRAELTVWRLRSDDATSGWRLVGKPLRADYEPGR